MQNTFPEHNQPLRIRAYLQSRVVSDKYLPLDGILYNIAVREKYGEQTVSLARQSTVPEGGGVRLPFGKHNSKNDSWFYACSFGQFSEPCIEYSDSYNKRFDLDMSDFIEFGNKRKVVDTGRGAMKSYHVKFYVRHSLYIDWFCTGDKAEIERLLKFATNIGKKASQGEGAVLRWEVKEWPEDWSIRGYENKLMRAVPAQNGVLYGLRPSYWLPKHQFRCKLP